MFYKHKFKKLIGFNHDWVVLLFIIFTGVSFPFIFLSNIQETIDQDLLKNVIGGIVFAAFLTIGNLFIFYQNKTSQINKENEHQIRFFLRNISIHFIFTVLGSVFMKFILGLVLQTSFMCGNTIRVLIGTTLLSWIYIGFYEALYYINALGKSLEAREQLKRENVVSQLEQLKNQVKPHFLFNSLNTLISIIPTEPEQAQKYVQNLSKVYRYILEIKDKKLIPLSEELACIKAYIFLLQIRFGNNLNIQIDENGFRDDHHLLPLSLQLLIENAVKHNIISSKKPLEIKIHSNDQSQIIVENNLQKKEQGMPSTETGLNNIRNRYQLLSNQDIIIQETADRFSVSIPLISVKMESDKN